MKNRFYDKDTVLESNLAACFMTMSRSDALILQPTYLYVSHTNKICINF